MNRYSFFLVLIFGGLTSWVSFYFFSDPQTVTPLQKIDRSMAQTQDKPQKDLAASVIPADVDITPPTANTQDKQPEERPTASNIAADIDITPQLATFGSFKKQQGEWQQKHSPNMPQTQNIKSIGDIVYHSDKSQMIIVFKDASFDWNPDTPKKMINPTALSMEVTIAWPMSDLTSDLISSELHDLWDVMGDIKVKTGKVRVVQAMDEDKDIIQFSFQNFQQAVATNDLKQTLNLLTTHFYNLIVENMLQESIEKTRSTAENLLSYLIGMPVYIASLEGDIKAGELIFEDITIGKKEDPLMTFRGGKIKYHIRSDQPKNTQLIVDTLNFFDPINYVTFFNKMASDGRPNESIYPVLQYVTEQYKKILSYKDRLYIPIDYNNVKVGEGAIITTQKDTVKRSQIPKLQFSPNILNTDTPDWISQTYALIGGYLGNIGQTSLQLINPPESAEAPSSPKETGNELNNAMNEILGLTPTPN